MIVFFEASNFTTWPTLTAQHAKQYLEKSEATVKGHMNQQRKNMRSTRSKQKQTAQDEEIEYTYEPHLTKCANVVYAAIHDLEGHTYTDLTGRFPKTPSRGYKYILVLYDYDGNNIQAEPTKNRSDTEAIRAYTKNVTNSPPKDSSPHSKQWIMKRQQRSHTSSNQKTPSSNLWHHTSIDRMLPKEQSRHLQTILLLDCAPLTNSSHCTYGTG
jgi:hypothetical protein